MLTFMHWYVLNNVGGESLLSANATFQPMKLMTLLVDNWTIGNFRQLTLIFYGFR